MKMKTAVGSLGSLFLLTFMFSSLVCAAPDPPKYDATGTWDFQFTNGWTDCFPEEPSDETSTATIIQSGDTFSIKLGDSAIQTGSIKGNRYQLPMGGLDMVGGAITQSMVWDLQSSSIGNGHVAMIQVDQVVKCSLTGDIHLQKRGVCKPTDTQMCLQNGRFSVEVTWKNQQGQTGVGHAIPSTDDSGLFWFFKDTNMELLIKVLNACGTPSKHYWVFFAATTDQEFTVTVTDLKTDEQVEYTNPLKNPADAVTDTSAFATCP